ncbi:hypothetical protein GDO81_000803 [Engystomops pustulosus]|uniref:Uncharacterized protein n=1 Tax=Engystomops pustulosus TaxID=76066 RepID=A0AAV7D8T3_ENGPU|nr:hypothetical protein GDO81_000803 [Engystomops pustulosus]
MENMAEMELSEVQLSTGREDAGAFFEQCNTRDNLQMMSTKALENRVSLLADKEIRLFWTNHSLKSYSDSNRVPRGLRIFKAAAQYQDDQVFMQRWKDLHLQHSLSIMRLVMGRNEMEYTKTIEELCKAKTELRTRLGETQFSVFIKKLEKKLVFTQIEVKEKKRDKFVRDKMDFEQGMIFDWGATKRQNYRKPHNAGNRKRKTKNTDFWTTESDSSFSDEPSKNNTDKPSTNVEGNLEASTPAPPLGHTSGGHAPGGEEGGRKNWHRNRKRKQVSWR